MPWRRWASRSRPQRGRWRILSPAAIPGSPPRACSPTGVPGSTRRFRSLVPSPRRNVEHLLQDLLDQRLVQVGLPALPLTLATGSGARIVQFRQRESDIEIDAAVNRPNILLPYLVDAIRRAERVYLVARLLAGAVGRPELLDARLWTVGARIRRAALADPVYPHSPEYGEALAWLPVVLRRSPADLEAQEADGRAAALAFTLSGLGDWHMEPVSDESREGYLWVSGADPKVDPALGQVIPVAFTLAHLGWRPGPGTHRAGQARRSPACPPHAGQPTPPPGIREGDLLLPFPWALDLIATMIFSVGADGTVTNSEPARPGLSIRDFWNADSPSGTAWGRPKYRGSPNWILPAVPNRMDDMFIDLLRRESRQPGSGASALAGLRAMARAGDEPDASAMSRRLYNTFTEQREVFRTLATQTNWSRLHRSHAFALVLAELAGRDRATDDLVNLQSVLLTMQWARHYRRLEPAKLAEISTAVLAHVRTRWVISTNIDLMGSRLNDLLADTSRRLRNAWELAEGTIEARSVAESYSGYASSFDPQAVARRPRLLPKYGVLRSPYQPLGSSFDYGSTVLQWKDEVRGRATFKPADNDKAAYLYTPATAGRYVARLLLEGPASTMRLAFAEATNFAHDPEYASIRDAPTIHRPGAALPRGPATRGPGLVRRERIVINFRPTPTGAGGKHRYRREHRRPKCAPGWSSSRASTGTTTRSSSAT